MWCWICVGGGRMGRCPVPGVRRRCRGRPTLSLSGPASSDEAAPHASCPNAMILWVRAAGGAPSEVWIGASAAGFCRGLPG